MLGLSVYAGLIGELVGILVAGFFGLVVLVVAAIFIVGVANRADADARGARAIAAYSFSAAFLFLWVTVVAVVAALDSLINLIGRPSYPSGTSLLPFVTGPDYDHVAARACVLGAIVVLFAGGAYLLHVRHGNALADEEPDQAGPTRRVLRSFVALVSFVAVLLVVAGFIVAIYDVFELISPSVFGGAASRTADARGLLDAVVLVVVAGAVFAFHQRFAPAPLRLLGGSRNRGRLPDASAPEA